MNNKGFVVSTILYTILVAFLLFLAITLSIFASAISTVSGGTDDLVNATNLSIKQVTVPCEELNNWYDSNILTVITSEYGEFYWPKDFGVSIDAGIINGDSIKGNLKVTCATSEGESFASCNGISITSVEFLKVENKNMSADTQFGDICNNT